MLEASWPERLRHWTNVTREPFQARRRREPSVLEYQFVLETKLPTSERSLIISAVPSASGFVYAKRLLRSSSCAALATNTAEALPLPSSARSGCTVLFHSRARAGGVAGGQQDAVLEAALDEVVLHRHGRGIVREHDAEEPRVQPVVGHEPRAARGLDVGAGVAPDRVARDRVVASAEPPA